MKMMSWFFILNQNFQTGCLMRRGSVIYFTLIARFLINPKNKATYGKGGVRITRMIIVDKSLTIDGNCIRGWQRVFEVVRSRRL